MSYPAIALAFRRQIYINSTKGIYQIQSQRPLTTKDVRENDEAQRAFLDNLKPLFDRSHLIEICASLDMLDPWDIYEVLYAASGREALKSFPKLHTTLLYYTRKGPHQDDAIAMTNQASDDDLLHPEKLMADYPGLTYD